MTGPLLFATLINLMLGVALGAVGGLLGIGGGLIAIPLLGFLYGMDQHLAQGTALVMILPNVLIGFVRYRQRNAIDLRATAWLGLIAVVTTALAARFAAHVRADQLRTAFAVFLLLLAAYFMAQVRARAHAEGEAPVPARFLPLLGVLSGAMSGFFSVGGGLVAVPVLVSLFGMRQTQAQGVALALVIPASVVALGSYGMAGHVDWRTGTALALGGLVSVSWGVALAHRFTALRLRLLFCAVLASTSLFMLLHR